MGGKEEKEEREEAEREGGRERREGGREERKGLSKEKPHFPSTLEENPVLHSRNHALSSSYAPSSLRKKRRSCE